MAGSNCAAPGFLWVNQKTETHLAAMVVGAVGLPTTIAQNLGMK